MITFCTYILLFLSSLFYFSEIAELLSVLESIRDLKDVEINTALSNSVSFNAVQHFFFVHNVTLNILTHRVLSCVMCLQDGNKYKILKCFLF